MISYVRNYSLFSSAATINFIQRKNSGQCVCFGVAGVRKRDGALRHDTFYSNAGHVRVSRERNAAVDRSAPPILFVYAARFPWFFGIHIFNFIA
jgi:hypothetical protein